jgi:hypothetical protein
MYRKKQCLLPRLQSHLCTWDWKIVIVVQKVVFFENCSSKVSFEGIQVGFCRQMVILQKWSLTQVWLYSPYVLFLLKLISILFFRFLILMDYISPIVNLMLTWLILVLIGHEVCNIAFILVPYGINFLIKPIFNFIK